MKKKIKIKRENIDKKHLKKDIYKLILVVIILATIAYFLWEPIQMFLTEDGRLILKDKIMKFGPFAPIIFVFIMALQVPLSILPAQFPMIFGGFVFGALKGTLLSMTGILIGSTITFFLGRKFGRPLIEDLVDPNFLKKFDKQSQTKGLITLFFIFLLPFTPDNAACLVAGLTKIRIRYLVLIAAIGRLPGTIVASMIGSGLGTKFNLWLWIAIIGISVLLFTGYFHRLKLEMLAKTYFAKRHIKKFEKKRNKRFKKK